jgi:hypothetical protein
VRSWARSRTGTAVAAVAALVAVLVIAAGARAETTSGTAKAAGVVLRWQTESEANMLGFNVFRERNRARIRLNRYLIRCITPGGLTGHSYSFRDGKAPNGPLRYWLQIVNVDGSRTWEGPIDV